MNDDTRDVMMYNVHGHKKKKIASYVAAAFQPRISNTLFLRIFFFFLPEYYLKLHPTSWAPMFQAK